MHSILSTCKITGKATNVCLQSRVTALVNDAVASFAACRYTDTDTMLGVILGTGVNGAYVEQAERVLNAGKKLAADAHVIINCEWAEFVTEALPQMHADLELDAETVNPGHQVFEKMTAGMTILAGILLCELL